LRIPPGIPMLQSLTWHFLMFRGQVTLSKKLKVDWAHAVDFIAITVDMRDRSDVIFCMGTAEALGSPR
jgi:hypothetical protein